MNTASTRKGPGASAPSSHPRSNSNTQSAKPPTITTTNQAPHNGDEEQILDPLPMDFKIEGLTTEQQQYLTTQILRQTPEYEAAWSLELWKKNQQRVFLEHLEKQRKKLEAEWKQQLQLRDEKRKDILQNEQKRIEKLGQNLEKLIQETQQKQLQLNQDEKELTLKQTQLEIDYQRKLKDMQHQIKLTKEESAHKIQLERDLVKELQEKCDHLSNRNKILEQKNQALIDQLSELRKEYSTTDQTKLINENESLRNQVTELTASKAKYKLQWKKTTQTLEKQKRKYEMQIQEFMDRERQMFLDLQREWQAIRQDGVGMPSYNAWGAWNAPSTNAPFLRQQGPSAYPYGPNPMDPSNMYGGMPSMYSGMQQNLYPPHFMNQMNSAGPMPAHPQQPHPQQPQPPHSTSVPSNAPEQPEKNPEELAEEIKREILGIKNEELTEKSQKEAIEKEKEKTERKRVSEAQKPTQSPAKKVPTRIDKENVNQNKEGRSVSRPTSHASSKVAKPPSKSPASTKAPSSRSTSSRGTTKAPSKASSKSDREKEKQPQTAPTPTPVEGENSSNTIADEIKRITREKARLLQSGAYDETSPLILQLNDKLEKLIENSRV